jgi:hypothetical protein
MCPVFVSPITVTLFSDPDVIEVLFIWTWKSNLFSCFHFVLFRFRIFRVSCTGPLLTVSLAPLVTTRRYTNPYLVWQYRCRDPGQELWHPAVQLFLICTLLYKYLPT